MSINIVFLGTGGAVPTPKRSLPAIILQRGNEQVMFDCGEASQRQMILAKISLHKKLQILISHMHGDHVLGLPGLLQTMALMNRQKPVEVYGPLGIAYFLDCLRETLHFQLTFQVTVHEILNPGTIFDNKVFTISAISSSHVVTSFCYSFEEKPRPGKFHPEKAQDLGIPMGEAWSKLQLGEEYILPNGRIVKPEDVVDSPRKGRKVIYTGDTRPFRNFVDFAVDADLVIHEATFDDSLAEKAEIDGHSTSSQAASETKSANAKMLVLTHLSARYTDDSLILEQAKRIFPNTIVAKDFLELKLELRK